MWIAVLLAGGRGSRLGGRHKPGITVGGMTLLDRAVTAVTGAAETIVVGPAQATCRPVCWTVEQPRGGGPVAALAAGLAARTTEADEVVLLAADLVGITQDTVARLRAELRSTTAGVVLRDAAGRRQWLIGAWRLGALAAALPAEPAGASLFSVLSTLAVTELPELPDESADVDTPADLARYSTAPPEGQVAGGASQPSHW
ncbi:MAG TPA: NTP transferase domain-containing protein [Pseudonocardiaceae bacterium]|nr:NTP transferase domain-containing protein [Pseudonocardiaceae bacterium]